MVSWPASVSVNISAMSSSSSKRDFGSSDEFALTAGSTESVTAVGSRGRGVHWTLTQDAHDVLARALFLHVRVRPLLANDLPAVLPEEVVEVAKTRPRMHRDVSDQLEEGAGDVVPRRAEKDGGLAGEVVHILAVEFDLSEPSMPMPQRAAYKMSS